MSTDPLVDITLSTALDTRRQMLMRCGGGLGGLALSALLNNESLAADGSAKVQHFPARAKRVIWLFMEGGPSAVDLLDYKPTLDRMDGKQPTSEIHTHFGRPGPLMKSPFSFAQHGQSGLWLSDRLPNMAKVADRLCVIKSCWSESNNHGPAMLQINTGIPRPGSPSAGAWVSYGLGTENENLPAFVVLQNPKGSKGGAPNWGSGYLPGNHQGTLLRTGSTPILNLDKPNGVTAASQRNMLDYAQKNNQQHSHDRPQAPDLKARIESLELGFRMQMEASDVANFADETEESQRAYGLFEETTRPFGEKCLLARRLLERGVRFVQVYCADEWDAHGNIVDNHTQRCSETDRGSAALIEDLAQRGLLDDTLVIWGGEFGRMPVSEQGKGRDHNPEGFVTVMAGGGIRPGISYGATDEVGWQAVDNRVSVHDLHATMLHLLGIDHERLTYLHNGRRFRLTDVAGVVVKDIIS